jgi:hypothetical protein
MDYYIKVVTIIYIIIILSNHLLCDYHYSYQKLLLYTQINICVHV